ncbi:hypothetical protein [Pseudomonas sp. Marseille-QA0892]
MRALADLIMRGRMQATLVVVGSAALPLLFWLSAAASSLVLLRRGLSDAFGIVVWALLPALAWWYFGEPRTLMVMLGTLALAFVLRSTASWVRTLMASVAVGVVFGLLLSVVFGESIQALASEFEKFLPQLLGDTYEQLSPDERTRLAGLLAAVLTGLMAALLQLVTILSLMLGRYWQALLYNPGGFGAEFRALRLPVPLTVLLVVGMLLGPNLGPQMAMLTPICSVPLAFAGLAVIHGMGFSRFWLAGLYVVVVLFMHVIYPLLVVLAIVDSLIDFRGRRRRDENAKDDSTGGEG